MGSDFPFHALASDSGFNKLPSLYFTLFFIPGKVESLRELWGARYETCRLGWHPAGGFFGGLEPLAR